MAFNPSTSKVFSSNQTNLPNNRSANDPRAYNPQGYNTFDRSCKNGTTLSFADVTPIYCVPEIEGNVARVRVPHSLNTYTLNSRVLNQVRMDKTFASIPWSSIAPNTWELLYKEPIGTEDIDYHNVSQSILLRNLYSAYTSLFYYVTRPTFDLSLRQYLSYLIPIVLSCNLWLSNSSIIKRLTTSLPAEDESDDVYSALVEFMRSFTAVERYSFVDSNNVVHSFSPSSDDLSALMQFLDDYRFYSVYLASHPTSDISDSAYLSILGDSSIMDSTVDELEESLLSQITDFETKIDNFRILLNSIRSSIPSDVLLNLQPCVAYQQFISQFFTNSSVDDIYSAKQWSDNVLGMLRYPTDVTGKNPLSFFANSFSSTTFELDGVIYSYDVFAGFFNNHILTSVNTLSSSSDIFISDMIAQFFAYSSLLLGTARSLRYGDYFVSGRPRPFAGDDVVIDVGSSGSVTALEVNKSQWIQRFRNAVNRVPRNIYEYMKGIAGVEPSRIAPQPNYIATESYTLFKNEIENTSDNQGNIVTLFQSQEDRFAYEVMIDEPSYVIGVVSFVSDNLYPKASHKISFMSDRLDWFNHFMQHTGDESVQAKELYNNASMYGDVPISYQLRYSGFKNGLSRLSGGFSYGSLPTWYIKRDFDKLEGYDGSAPIISPEFIRNRNSEFDPLYESLSGTNLSERFHFIVGFINNDFVNSRQADYPRLDV